MSDLPTLGFAPGAGDVVLDVDALLEYGLVILAASTFGKTTLMRLAAEQTFGHVQHLVLDADGELLNLRSAARPYLILGPGRDVDLPASEAAVRALVLKLTELGQSAIIDLTEYEDDEQQLIVAAACDALASRPFDAPGDVLVFLPELQDFAPEGGGKDTALDSIRRLAKRGAKRGARLIADTQRVADVKKGVVTQLKNKAIGAQDHADVKRAAEELGLPPSARAQLLSLERGVFYLKSPAVARHATLVRVPPPETMRGKRRRGERPAPPAEAPAEIAALAAALRETAAAAAAPPRVERVEDDGTTSRPYVPVPDPAALAAEYERGRSDGAAEAVGQIAAVHGDAVEVLRAIGRQLEEVATSLLQPVAIERDVMPSLGARQLAAYDQAERATASIRNDPVEPRTDSAPRRNGKRPPRNERASVRNDGAAGSHDQRLLNALAELEILNVSPAPRETVGAMAGASFLSGPFRAAAKRLREAGLVEDVDGGLLLTDAGRLRAVADDAPRRLADFHARWLARLPERHAQLLGVLLERTAHGVPLSREALGTAVGISAQSGPFRGAVKDLYTARAVEYPAPGMLRASALLFPKGLRR